MSQETAKPTVIERTVVTATRTEVDEFELPYAVDVVDSEDLFYRQQVRTLPEALEETPGVLVQKTSYGQGSPFIRGFTGFRTLLLVDGIRLNNSVFREGPNQYWNTVDPLTIERLEVIKGPGSVLYGSDAIGGTVNAITQSRDIFSDEFDWDRRLYYRYASAEDSNIGRAELSAAMDQQWGVLVGISGKDFNDIRGGNDVGDLPKTGYQELNADLKLEYRFNENARMIMAHQRVYQEDVWRTHRTLYAVPWEGTEAGTDRKHRFDQERQLTYLQFHAEHLDMPIQAIRTGVSHQLHEEDNFKVSESFTSEKQGFDVNTGGAFLQLESDSPIGYWTYGFDYYRDWVNSYKRKYEIDGTLDKIEIQGPVADDATYDLFGVFVQDQIPFLDDRLELILGSRYTYAHANANEVKDPVTDNQISLEEEWDSIVGSGRLIYFLDEERHWNVFGGVSQGFRAPNLSDLTRLDVARSGEIETPAPGLDPEEFVSYETGIKTRYERWSGEISYFYTDINDMIIRTPTGRVVDGDLEVTKLNAGEGYIHGIEVGGSYEFIPQFTAFGWASWMEGKVETFATSGTEKSTEQPASRLTPPTLHLGLRWEHPRQRLWAEVVTTLTQEQDQLSPDDRRDTQRIPPNGTPGYALWTLRGGYEIIQDLILTAAVENITDEDYRVHGSGQNEPGRNFVVSVDFRF